MGCAAATLKAVAARRAGPYAPLQAPFITVIGCVLATGERSEQADRMFLSMARRAICAIEDLEVLDLFS